MTVGCVVPDPRTAVSPLRAPPTFSVVIAVYQGAHIVADAIESVLAQTVPAHEILVCDDGSTDDLAGAIAPYGDKVILLRQEHKGVAAARNLALAHATGEFMAGCDADDIVLPRFIEALGNLAMARPDLDILVPTGYFERDGVFVGLGPNLGKPPFPADDLRMGLLRDFVIPQGSGVRRQRVLDVGGFNEALLCAEDFDVWLRLVFSGSQAGQVLEPLWVWQQHKGSLSTKDVWCMHGSIDTLTKLLERGDLSAAERTLIGQRMDSFRGQLRRAEAKAALVEAQGDARRLCLAVVMSKGQTMRDRVRAAAAALSPRLAGRRIEA